MCLWKMPPSVNRKFALFAIFFEKSARVIFNILILFIFIVFMQNLPQSCTAGFPVVAFWMAGLAAFGRLRRARRSARQAWCRRGRAALNDRRLSAEAERRAHLSEKAFCLSRASAGSARQHRRSPASGTGPLQVSFTETSAEGADCQPKTPVCPQGRATKKKRATHEDREQL